MSKMAIYQAKDGSIEMSVDETNETIWATQRQIAEVFGVKTPAISKHITNILDEGELDTSTISKMETVEIEGGRQVSRNVTRYNLDMIISIGYRVTSSKNATEFRK